MRAKRSLGLVALAAAFSLAACNVLTGLSEDFELKDADAGAPVDSGAGDTTPPDEDAGVRDGSEPPADGGTFCSTVDAEFCTDFEQDGLALSDNANDAGGAVFQVLPGAGAGASRGLDVALASTLTSANSWRARSFVHNATDSRYVLEFDVFVETTSLAYAAVGMLTFPGSSDEYGLAVTSSPKAFTLHDPKGEADMTVGDIEGKWHHVTVTLDKVDGGGSFAGTLEVDKQTIDSASIVAPKVPTDTLEIRFGTFATSATGELHVRFDNVILRRQ